MLQTAYPLAGIRVLLVDGHADSLYLATLALEGCHFNVLPVTSAQQALTALPTFEPDILISELRLPDQDGYAFMHQVNAYLKRQQRHLPAIALTTQRDNQAIARAYSVGYRRFIPKPYNIATLVKAVTELSTPDTSIADHCYCDA